MQLACFLFLYQIDRIETIHKAGWVYIDIKPENFAIGKHDTWLIYMFGKIFCSENGRDEKFTLNRIFIHSDFGLCQRFLDENGKHIAPGLPARYGPGTIEFMSIRAHKTQILSRRDDIEGIGYLILYFLQGTLPWSEDMHHSSHETTSNVVQQKKIDFKIEVRIYRNSHVKHMIWSWWLRWFSFLFQELGGYAARMGKYFEYTWELEFETEPDYKYLRKLLEEILS